VAADAVLFAAVYPIIPGVIVVGLEGALINTHLAPYTASFISLYNESGWQIGLHGKPNSHFSLQLPVASTSGFQPTYHSSPPMGVQARSRSGQTSLMADSSEER